MLKKFTDTGLAIIGYVLGGFLPAGYIVWNSCEKETLDFNGFIPAISILATLIMAIRRRWKY
jgi:hypothetical protein